MNTQKLSSASTALQCLSCIDITGDEHEWKKVMEAARNSGVSMEDFDKWSQTQPNYEAGCVKKWWGRYSKPISPGYLVNLAKQNPKYSVVRKNTKKKRRIPKPSSNWQLTDLKRFFEVLNFQKDEYVVYVPELYLDSNRKVCPGTQIATRTVKSLINTNEKISDVIGQKGNLGAWIKINPTDGNGKSESNITAFRNVILESDSMSLENQWQFINKFKIPCAAVLHSGNKSLHAIVNINATDKKEYDEKVRWLYDAVTQLGYIPDVSCGPASKFTRVPGILREGKPQYLVATNIGIPTFNEWKEYIEQKLNWPDINEDLHFKALPEFPLSALPGPLGNFVNDISVTFKVPIEIPALCVLTAVGLAIGRNVYTEIKGGVKARANIYSFIFVARGERKSCVFEPILKPIEYWIIGKLPDYEKQLFKKHLLGKRITRLENIITATNTLAEERLDAEEKLEILVREQKEFSVRNPNILAEDATREGIRNLMAETQGTVGIFSDDSRIFLKILLGLYSKESSEDIHLKSFDGTSPIRSHRASFNNIIIERPCESLLLMVQNDFLERLGKKREFFDSGFFSRYLFCFPDSWVGRKNSDGTLKRAYDEREISSKHETEYANLINKLLNHSYHSNNPEIFKVMPSAKKLWVDFYHSVESQCGKGGDLHETIDLAIRYPCLALRLALIFSACRNFNEKKINFHDMQNALSTLIYYTQHTERCFQAMKGYQLPSDSRLVLNQIRKKQINEFTVRDMQRAIGIKTAEQTQLAINLLIDKGFVREKIYFPSHSKQTGRKPSTIYETNPQIFRKESHNGLFS